MQQAAPRPDSAKAATPRPPRAHQGVRILIVDDRPSAKALAQMLTVTGYDEVRSVMSAARALALAESFRPSIVFLDVELPNDGEYDLARKLRGVGLKRLVALTKGTGAPLREEARAAGFECLLAKPVNQVELDKIMARPMNSGS